MCRGLGLRAGWADGCPLGVHVPFLQASIVTACGIPGQASMVGCIGNMSLGF